VGIKCINPYQRHVCHICRKKAYKGRSITSSIAS
jgi:hypothetical protein